MNEKLLESDKKVCSKDKLLRTLSAIYTFDLGEGEGGQIGYYGTGYAGTGLRHPDMPLHNMPESHRHCVLNHLIDNNLVKMEDDYQKLTITQLGISVLEEFDRCSECGERIEYYHTKYSVQTGQTSGFGGEGVGRFCKCELEKRNRPTGLVRDSHRVGVIKKIEPKQKGGKND